MSACRSYMLSKIWYADCTATRNNSAETMIIADRMLTKNLALTADIINTINGGMARTEIKLKKSETEWNAVIRIPGVSFENIKLEIKDRHLHIFQTLDESNASEIQLPYLVSSILLSSKVDVDKIHAEFENSRLYVHLPITETPSGYQREIDIQKL